MVSTTLLAQCARRVIGAGLAFAICALPTCGRLNKAAIRVNVFASMDTLVLMVGPLLHALLASTRIPGALHPVTCVLLEPALLHWQPLVCPHVPAVDMDSTTCILGSPPALCVRQALPLINLGLLFAGSVQQESSLLKGQPLVPIAWLEPILPLWVLLAYHCA